MQHSTSDDELVIEVQPTPKDPPLNKKAYAIGSIILVVFFLILILLEIFNETLCERFHCDKDLFEVDYIFLAWLVTIAVGSVWTTMFLCGLAVTKGRLRPNYSRKIVHFMNFFGALVPVFIVGSPTPSIAFGLWQTLLLFLEILPFLGLFRYRVKIIKIMWKSMERPEDYPHSMDYVVIQYCTGFMALIPFYTYFIVIDRFLLLGAIALVATVGDGLAEPVGIKWGKHKYQAKALYYQGSWCAGNFTRSLEGSTCVFVSGVLGSFVTFLYFTPVQIIATFLSFPIAMTMAEAFSPHTMDSPFLVTVGGLLLVAIGFIPV